MVYVLRIALYNVWHMSYLTSCTIVRHNAFSAFEGTRNLEALQDVFDTVKLCSKSMIQNVNKSLTQQVPTYNPLKNVLDI